ncbi:hypothetical protein [Hymenobacter cellulosilyticus]|uniref:Uncharacterized protein n=1 Tax=Hymenobacter cellulosilyticus TaxID=2932248 RepID=A0A8T9Q892_9BACT|nr:hypothetical protein [Hymenobacter cellulosilyticus]UOQ72631.1 hypothetical protein MUN79_01125 [Hymenobacter cellulosilyticus]
MARMQRRMSMNPDEVKRDQQLEILEARSGGTANTSFGRASGPARQYEKGNSGFTVRKFKDKRGTAQQKRGQSRRAPALTQGQAAQAQKEAPVPVFLGSLIAEQQKSPVAALRGFLHLQRPRATVRPRRC